MARLGVGGPSLTSASFRAGIDELTATLGNNTERLLDAEKAKSVKTFSGKHGDALSQSLMNWCDVTDELDLPEVHRLLLVTPKSGEHGMLGAMFNERTLACGLSLTQASAPLPAPKLIHNVFRS